MLVEFNKGNPPLPVHPTPTSLFISFSLLHTLNSSLHPPQRAHTHLPVFPSVNTSSNDIRFGDACFTSQISLFALWIWLRIVQHFFALWWRWVWSSIFIPDISQNCEWAIATYGELPGNEGLQFAQCSVVYLPKKLSSNFIETFEVSYSGWSNMNVIPLLQQNCICH